MLRTIVHPSNSQARIYASPKHNTHCMVNKVRDRYQLMSMLIQDQQEDKQIKSFYFELSFNNDYNKLYIMRCNEM